MTKLRPLTLCLKWRIELRVAQLSLLAAQTAVGYWRDRTIPPVIRDWDGAGHEHEADRLQ